ncbi:unnamed protein product, partial [Mesorhabditis belari]|uniref:Amino acid transporter transmembrane domain-containing protein n=1 Tax=Mesorhabditis belari TaxID=2138241 RepID=A0AAF3ENH5_9BILA
MSETKKKLLGDPLASNYHLVASANTMETGSLRFMNEKHRNLHGMGWFVTCLFIVGETAGGGLIALPSALSNAGIFSGLLIVAVVAAACMYTGMQLSDNWAILQQRWPEYREHCRKPYPAMGNRSLGPGFGKFVSFCLDLTCFGTACVFLLLAAKNIESFLIAWGGVEIGFCQILIYVSICVLPVTMLKSPKDFWWAVMLAMVTTTIAVSLIIYGSIEDYPTCSRHISYPEFSMEKTFMSFGTVVFAYGGHGAFPTIQHDMREPYKFGKACTLAFVLICVMYLPVSLTGYFTYGGSLMDTIIPSLQNANLQMAVNCLITLHVILALTIMFNPINQSFEELMKVPHDFCWQRVAARTFVMACVVFAAESVPNFGPLLDLVGGSTITLMALIFPCVFNLCLCAGKEKYKGEEASKDEEPVSLSDILEYTPKKKLLINLLVLLMAVIGGCAATFSAVDTMMNLEFHPPCYAAWFTGHLPNSQTAHLDNHGKFACCGEHRNISRFGLDYCLNPFEQIGAASHG